VRKRKTPYLAKRLGGDNCFLEGFKPTQCNTLIICLSLNKKATRRSGSFLSLIQVSVEVQADTPKKPLLRGGMVVLAFFKKSTNMLLDFFIAKLHKTNIFQYRAFTPPALCAI
jgi:hypothetical protein